MPEVPNLPLLFAQLQARYPTSGLLTELVQIHADQFVVRAIVQLGNMTLATSLATAATVEQAEDQARLRVLALLGIYSAFHSVPIAIPEAPVPHVNTPITSLGLGFKDTTRPTMPVDSLPPPIALSDSEAAIAPPPAFPPLASEPALVTDLPKTDFSTTTVEPSVPTLDLPEIALESWEAPLDDGPPDEAPLDDVPYDHAPYDEEPYDEPEPFIEEEPDRAVTPNDALPAVTEAPASKSKPRKSGASKESSLSSVDQPESASRDLSSLISQIGVEIDRIGWSKRQGSTYLQKTYGKKTRSELTDDELEDFLTYLNTQPSAGEE